MAENKEVATTQGNVLTKREKTNSERFTDMVVREFVGTGGEIALTAFQKRLVQNYFISIDQTLKMAEEKRMKKDEKYRDALALTWNNVNMESLAVHIVACARIGFDPAQANHINMIPYKNNTTKKYEIVFIEGYRGKELKARKYGYDIPDDVVIELVYSNDKFKQFKKDKNNPIETYTFEVSENFNRGEIVGGFYYFLYIKTPQKNKLMVYSKNDLEKRRPDKASPEFWGGEKDKWENGKKVGTEKVEGWYDEMMWKTLCRLAYSNITIDSQKIDDDYIKLSVNDKLANETLEERVDNTIKKEANVQTIDIPSEVVPETEQKFIEPIEPEAVVEHTDPGEQEKAKRGRPAAVKPQDNKPEEPKMQF